MADNKTVDNGVLTDYPVATDEVTYSGDTADVQLLRPVHVTGTEGAKTVVEITDANGLFGQGSIAHDGVDAGKPVKIGGKVPVDSEATPTEVAVSDRVDAWFERDGAQVVGNREAVRQDATWTSSTGVNTTLELDCSRMGSGIIWMRPTGTITAGALTFECTINGGTSWVPLSGTNGNRVQTGVTLGGADYWNGSEAGWRFPIQAFDRIRVRLSTGITGSGSLYVSARAISAATNPFVLSRSQFSQQTGTITGTGTNVVDIEAQDGSPVLQISNSGTAWSGTIIFEQSPDGVNWTAAIAFNQQSFSGVEFQTTANGVWNFVGSSGMRYLRVRGASVTNTAAIFWSGGSVGSDTSMVIACGDKAHDATDLNTFPIKIGSRAESTRPTTVADADRVNAWFDTVGRQVVQIGSSQRQTLIAVEYTADQTDTSLIAAPGANLRIVIDDLIVSAGSAGTVLFESGTTTRLIGRLSFGANGGLSHPSVTGIPVPINTALTVTSTGTINPLAIVVNYHIEQDLTVAAVA